VVSRSLPGYLPSFRALSPASYAPAHPVKPHVKLFGWISSFVAQDLLYLVLSLPGSSTLLSHWRPSFGSQHVQIQGHPSPKPMMHIPPISAKFINFPPIFVRFFFLLIYVFCFPIFWPWCRATAQKCGQKCDFCICNIWVGLYLRTCTLSCSVVI